MFKSASGPYYNSREWRGLRRQCLKRDQHTCARCGHRFSADKLQAHHIIPRSERGPDTLTNLITVCVPCHDFIEGRGLLTRAAIAGSYGESADDAIYAVHRHATQGPARIIAMPSPAPHIRPANIRGMKKPGHAWRPNAFAPHYADGLHVCPNCGCEKCRARFNCPV